MGRYPAVRQEVFYPAEGAAPIVVETPAWFAWLREHTAFTYQDADFRFTARREQRPGGMYWYAYRRAQGKLLKRYLGRGDDLTRQRLREVAQLLVPESREEVAAPTVFPGAARSEHLANRGRITLLATKFQIPVLPVHHIARPRLQEELEQQTKARLALLSAPAGAGKTTLLAEWARTTANAVVWLSLEETDDDPLRFLTYLTGAFTHLTNQSASLSTGSSWEKILTPFLNDLTRLLTGQTVLVLDDYHLIESPAIHAALSFLIEHAPPYLHLLIGTRNDPPLPLTRLRARGQLSELRMDVLRFVSSEVQAFLQMMGLQLAPDLQQVFEERTQGWIVSIQLLALALRAQPQPAALLANSPGSHPFFLEYVSEELLARLPPEESQFLLYTSVLDRLTGSLCEAVTELPDGQARLAAYYQGHVLLNALDDVGTWYRYHPLFAEALRTHLRRREPDMLPVLYRRASCWYEARGEAEEACHYAFLSGDMQRAAQLLERLLFTLIAEGKFSRLGRWLDQLPKDMIAQSLQLTIALLWRQALGTRSREHVEKMLEQFVRRGPGQEDAASWVDLHSQLALLQVLSVLSQNDPEQTIATLEEALRSLPAQQTVLNRFIALLLRMILHAMYRIHGDLAAAEQILLDISLPHNLEHIYPLDLIGWWGLAELYETQGRLRLWGLRYEQLFRVLGPYLDLPPLPLSVVLMSKTMLLYEWNRLQEAAETIHEALLLTERIDFNPFSVLGHWLEARIELAQGHFERVKAFLERQAKLLPGLPYPELAARPARLALACGLFEMAWQWAQRRGLRFDDQLTFRSNYFEYMTLARVLIARGRRERDGVLLSQALSLLERWRAIAVTHELEGNLIEIQMLTALAFAAQGKTKRALRVLGPLLERAEPEGYIRLFADEGQPMAHLLTYTSAATSASLEYLRTLQAALVPTQEFVPDSPPVAPSQQSLIEPLTARELEILHLLAAGSSNQQIAHQLVISLNTVKRHVQHIIAKLSVTNRTQAVASARALRLL
jgi:LuxR family maltose regulon positive regulatory protein